MSDSPTSDSSGSSVSTGPGLDAFRGASRAERALLPFLREPTLWPILLVIVAHVVLLISPLMALVWHEQHAWSIFGLVVLAVPSVLAIATEVRRRHTYLLSALIGAVWLLCAVCAWVGVVVEIL